MNFGKLNKKQVHWYGIWNEAWRGTCRKIRCGIWHEIWYKIRGGNEGKLRRLNL